MASRSYVFGATLTLLYLIASSHAADTLALDKAAQYDLEGKAQLAFQTYLEAARSGSPEAEFNVAVMLDSGRGVLADAAKAATWYARAAAHGNQRAAYNLGLLYEVGQGVSRNVGLAHAWFVASNLPASKEHLAKARFPSIKVSGTLLAPTPVSPSIGEQVRPINGFVELIWTSNCDFKAAQFLVEVDLVDRYGYREVFADTISISSVLAPLDTNRNYVWRVTVIDKTHGRYAAGEWKRFSTN